MPTSEARDHRPPSTNEADLAQPGDDGVWEAIAAGMRALRDGDPTGYHGRTPGQLADAVLALPEIAALCAKADAADRVRELAERWMRAGGGPWAVELRRALDGGVE